MSVWSFCSLRGADSQDFSLIFDWTIWSRPFPESTSLQESQTSPLILLEQQSLFLCHRWTAWPVFPVNFEGVPSCRPQNNTEVCTLRTLNREGFQDRFFFSAASLLSSPKEVLFPCWWAAPCCNPSEISEYQLHWSFLRDVDSQLLLWSHTTNT